jgi:hypothetical protein
MLSEHRPAVRQQITTIDRGTPFGLKYLRKKWRSEVYEPKQNQQSNKERHF